jgi:hypothetical protein
MRRSVGITISAGVQILGGLLTAMMAVGVLAVALGLLPQVSGAQVSGPQGGPPRELLAVGGVLTLGFALLAVATAAGLLGLRPWARRSTMVFAGLLGTMGLLQLPVVLLMPMPAQPGVPSMRPFMVSYCLLLAGCGAGWLFYFTRPRIRAQFAADGAPARAPGGRPLSITLVGSFVLLGGFGLAAAVLLPLPMMLLGQLVFGWAAKLACLGLAVVQLYAGVALLRLRPIGRALAIGTLALGLVNMALFQLLPGREARLQALLDANRAWLGPAAATPSANGAYGPAWTVLVGLFSAAMIYVLVTRRAAFERAASSGPAGA